MQSIATLIQQQLDTNKSRNLLFNNAAQIMSVEPGFLAALEDILSSNIGDMLEGVNSEFVPFAANELVRRLHSINPYLRVSKAQVENLEQIYRRTWQIMIKTRNVKATLDEFHYPELSKWLTALYPQKFRKLLKLSPSLGHITYSEYSVELQIALLGIDATCITQPVIDIGCGSQANLVRYFRTLGIEAFGVDRLLETHEPYLDQVDWFDYYFEPGKWGTIVSNMGFTNHLNYAYLHDISQLEHYLLKMKEIMVSLSSNGCFYYAPSLPFIEDKLSTESYKVKREQKINDVFASVITRIK
jgi:hypothetical protein